MPAFVEACVSSNSCCSIRLVCISKYGTSTTERKTGATAVGRSGNKTSFTGLTKAAEYSSYSSSYMSHRSSDTSGTGVGASTLAKHGSPSRTGALETTAGRFWVSSERERERARLSRLVLFDAEARHRAESQVMQMSHGSVREQFFTFR